MPSLYDPATLTTLPLYHTTSTEQHTYDTNLEPQHLDYFGSERVGSDLDRGLQVPELIGPAGPGSYQPLSMAQRRSSQHTEADLHLLSSADDGAFTDSEDDGSASVMSRSSKRSARYACFRAHVAQPLDYL